MANTFGKVSGTFEEIDEIYAKVSGNWREVDEVYGKVSLTSGTHEFYAEQSRFIGFKLL